MKLDSSRAIIERAIAEYEPYAIVCMISGGKDSTCAYLVAKALGVPVTHIMHGITGTGIPETTEFVRGFAAGEDATYIEADAGDAYEKYVLRKGFFGKGRRAHTFAYHIVKHEHFTRCVGHNIRHRKRNRPVLFVNGARVSESANRAKNLAEPIRRDAVSKNNIWVNIIHDWEDQDRDAFLDQVGAPLNPVAQTLCRSAECMCGTMQSLEARTEAAFFYPEWGKWLDELEARVRQQFPWGWGEGISKDYTREQQGQLALFQPMCVGCARDFELQNPEEPET